MVLPLLQLVPLAAIFLAWIQEPDTQALAREKDLGWTTHAAPKEPAEGAREADWPTFLGPGRNAQCVETGLAFDWDEDGPPLLWERERGEGYSCPVVADGRLVFVHRESGESLVDCLDALTGRLLWRRRIPSVFDGEIIENDGPRSTPVIHAGRVYVHDVAGGLYAFELASGDVHWKRDLREELHAPDNFFGVVSSPLVHAGLLIQSIGAPDGGPCVAAFDLDTGELVWGTPSSASSSCASPVLGMVGERAKVFVVTGGKSRPPRGALLVLDALTGGLEYEYPYRSRVYYSVNGSSPVLGAGRVLLTSSYGLGSVGIDLPDAEESYRESWKDRHLQVEFGTPVFVAGWFYLPVGTAGGYGALVAVDPASGEEMSRTDLEFEERVGTAGELITTSVGQAALLAVGERILCLGDGGALFWLLVSSAGIEVLAHTSLFHAPETWTPPVISHGLLYICQNNPDRVTGRGRRLLCYDLRAGESE